MLGQLTWQNESDGSLDLPRRDGRSLVVGSKLRGLSGNTLENIVNERVHDGHGLGGDTSIGVGLLENLVNVRRVSLLSSLASLLLLTRGGGNGGLLTGFLLVSDGGLASGGLGGGLLFGNHCKCSSGVL